MFANFTEETATDASGVLTLTGVTTGMIPFSGSFTDGDLVSYVAEDASSKVAGIGIYSADTITRDDTWNYDGTVVDKSPSTNIALSGTVTVRCDATDSNLNIPPYKGIPNRYGRGIIGDNFTGLSTNSSGIAQPVDTLKATTHRFNAGMHISKITFSVSTAGLAGELAKVGIWKHVNENSTGEVIWESGAIAVDSTGFKSVTCDVDLPAGLYDIGFVTNSATMKPRTMNSVTGANLYYVENQGYSEFCKHSTINSLWTSAPIGDNPITGAQTAGTYTFPYIHFNANSI